MLQTGMVIVEDKLVCQPEASAETHDVGLAQEEGFCYYLVAGFTIPSPTL
jgi:hypothetical protein